MSSLNFPLLYPFLFLLASQLSTPTEVPGVKDPLLYNLFLFHYYVVCASSCMSLTLYSLDFDEP